MRIVNLIALALAGLVTVTAQATDFPRKPIQVVVPFGPGGAVDVIGRIIGEHMSKTLGQPIVVLNRPGANANIGPGVVSQAAPDGYTLLASSTALIVNPLIEKNLSWSPKQFVPIARYVQAPNVIVVPASSQIATIADFVKHAKANPGLATSLAGPGTPQAMSREYFTRAAGIDMLDVAYKGGVSYLPDLIAGRLAMSVAPMNVVAQLVKEGQLAALATTGERRSPMLPETPTVAEAGYPEATAVSWYGLHAPAGTPQPVVERIAAAVRAATADPNTQARIAALGAETAFLDTPSFESFLGRESVKARKFVSTIVATR